jgi:hypothetical protein
VKGGYCVDGGGTEEVTDPKPGGTSVPGKEGDGDGLDLSSKEMSSLAVVMVDEAWSIEATVPVWEVEPDLSVVDLVATKGRGGEHGGEGSSSLCWKAGRLFDGCG